jgi:hypothetical protein
MAEMTIRDGAYKIHNKPDLRSDYLKALDKCDHVAKEIEGVCPYGCTSKETDDLGYCDHLIGFTNANLPEGKVTKQPPADAVIELLSDTKTRDGIQRRIVTQGRAPIQIGDHLVKITCTRRVYRLPIKDETAGKDALSATIPVTPPVQLPTANQAKAPAAPLPAPIG